MNDTLQKKIITLNVTTGTDCAIECAVVSSYLSFNKTRRDG